MRKYLNKGLKIKPFIYVITFPIYIYNFNPINTSHNVLHHKESIEDGLGWPVLSLVGCLATCYIMLFLTLWKGVAR